MADKILLNIAYYVLSEAMHARHIVQLGCRFYAAAYSIIIWTIKINCMYWEMCVDVCGFH